MDEQRERELQLLRRLCLPPLCFLLHSILHSAEVFEEVSTIAEVVASEQHQLYKVNKLSLSLSLPFSLKKCRLFLFCFNFSILQSFSRYVTSSVKVSI